MAVILAFAFVGACSADGPPESCPAQDDERYNRCISEHLQKNLRSFVEKCLPAVEPARHEGTWATDFEFDVFSEGRELTPKDAWQYPDHPTGLDVQGTPLESFATDKNASVLYIEFVGRKVPCGVMGPDNDLILVDKVTSRRVIEARPSTWYD